MVRYKILTAGSQESLNQFAAFKDKLVISYPELEFIEKNFECIKKPTFTSLEFKNITRGIKKNTIPIDELKKSAKKGIRIFQALDDFSHLVLCAFARIHKNFPIIVIRFYNPLQKLHSGKFARRLYNNLIYVNVFPRVDDRLFWEEQEKTAGMTMGNKTFPENLEQQNNLSFLHHCYKSLYPSPKDFSHIGLTYVSHFYCNQKSLKGVFKLFEDYEKYASNLLDKIQFVVVDDGSPLNYEIPNFNLNLLWIRINEDIPWNQAGARNLGVLYARSDKIVITDIDHFFPEKTLSHLVNRKNPDVFLFKFFRTVHNQKGLKRGHPNIFFMSRSRFLRFFGYEEEFSGHYGAEDFRFVKFQKSQGSRQIHLGKDYYIIDRDSLGLDRKKEYHTLFRDLSYNTPIDSRKRFETETFGEESGYNRLNYCYTWKIMADQRRNTRPPLQINRWWKKLWLLRQVFPTR